MKSGAVCCLAATLFLLSVMQGSFTGGEQGSSKSSGPSESSHLASNVVLPSEKRLDLSNAEFYSSYAFQFLMATGSVSGEEAPERVPMIFGQVWASNKEPQSVYVTFGAGMPVFGVWNQRLWICNASSRTMTLVEDTGVHLYARFTHSDLPKYQVEFAGGWLLTSHERSEVSIDVGSMLYGLGKRAGTNKDGDFLYAWVKTGEGTLVMTGCEVASGDGYPFSAMVSTVQKPTWQRQTMILQIRSIEVNKNHGTYSLESVCPELEREGFSVHRIPNAALNDKRDDTIASTLVHLIQEATDACNNQNLDKRTVKILNDIFGREMRAGSSTVTH